MICRNFTIGSATDWVSSMVLRIRSDSIFCSPIRRGIFPSSMEWHRLRNRSMYLSCWVRKGKTISNENVYTYNIFGSLGTCYLLYFFSFCKKCRSHLVKISVLKILKFKNLPVRLLLQILLTPKN